MPPSASGMPLDLILVRHGESEGNVAINASKRGDDRYFRIPGFRARPGHDWRLTERGVSQAMLAGEWLRSEFPDGFDRYYVSDFARAKETAVFLNLPNAVWFLNIYLHEQLWGRLDVVPRSEFERLFPGAQAERNRHRFYGTYPEGESMAEVCLRLDRILGTIGRECTDRRVILVCHGNVIWGFRMLIERLTPRQYHQLDAADNIRDRIHNGQIVHYSRSNPRDGTVIGHFGWRRSFLPSNPTLVKSDWQPIVRPTFTNAELLAELDHLPRLISE